MLLKNVQKIANFVENSGVDYPMRQRLITTILARHIAFGLAIPSSPVTSAKIYFLEQFDTEVSNLISDFNEQLIIDVNLTYRLTQQFWILRYRMVHDVCNHINPRTFFDAVVASGETADIPEDFVECLKQTDLEALRQLEFYIGKAVKEEKSE